MIKVLHVGLSLHYGGTESFVFNYMEAMASRNIVFDFVDIYGEGLANEDRIKALGGEVYYLKSYKRHPLDVKKNIISIIKNGGYKNVHIHLQSSANLIPVQAAILAGINPILHSHTTSAVGLTRKLLHTINVNRMRKLPAIHLACGELSGEWMWGSNNYKVIPNAIDIQKYGYNEVWRKKIRKKIGCSEDVFVIGYVGRITYEKNPLFFLDIMNYLNKKADFKAIVVMVGAGDLDIKMKKAVEQLNLSKQIIMVGKQSEANEWYSAMDCFALPSLFEGLPFVGIEAQAAGLPTILSDNITKEIELTKATVYLPITGGIEAWGDHIISIKNSNIDRQRISEEMKKSIYSIDKAVDILYKIYQ